MPAARESLLEAAGAALAARPWRAVRMVDVAAAAGVSRQTLYNEFGGKHGLGRALVRRETDRFLAGVDRALDLPAPPAERLAALADWTVTAARTHPVVRALLTGCWSDALPAPEAGFPAPRLPGAVPAEPGALTRAVRDRAAAALGPLHASPGHCELVVRLALSYVVAPAEEPAEPVLDHLLGAFSAPSPTAAGRSPRR
ncbi:TetR/AcrR family transcriptional regulator [Streptomyces antimicrobicus]|uniref:TetR/AcrR family transcriptional regulator n=1 Tax=Streptomyces antimicrobicus TaxID=2883108 RepID=A0ABS8BF52_9ACTN|nr:TetR/AcrR family transcriptional regulator [Streptomyces antimicrobicus]MCB5183240.1 TetR/AcrR family transcriptional regulator [Streptomyces antimicrobicus]